MVLYQLILLAALLSGSAEWGTDALRTVTVRRADGSMAASAAITRTDSNLDIRVVPGPDRALRRTRIPAGRSWRSAR